jgi:hypothetical protein
MLIPDAHMLLAVATLISYLSLIPLPSSPTVVSIADRPPLLLVPCPPLISVGGRWMLATMELISATRPFFYRDGSIYRHIYSGFRIEPPL